MLGSQWGRDELERFYEAYRKHGRDWRKVFLSLSNLRFTYPFRKKNVVDSQKFLFHCIVLLLYYMGTILFFSSIIKGFNDVEKTSAIFHFSFLEYTFMLAEYFMQILIVLDS